jgi:hypothetical protein
MHEIALSYFGLGIGRRRGYPHINTIGDREGGEGGNEVERGDFRLTAVLISMGGIAWRYAHPHKKENAINKFIP